MDNPHIPGDTGIFVTKVRENGAAFKDGRLKEGDKILEINGKDLSQVTHEDAVGCFTQSKDKVVLRVLHGAQEEILARRNRQDVKAPKKPDAGGTNWLYIGLCVGALTIGGYFFYRNRGRLTSFRFHDLPLPFAKNS